jgi:hypothetical protein
MYMNDADYQSAKARAKDGKVFGLAELEERYRADRLYELKKARACALLKPTELARRADREGWLVALLEWVTEEGRLPEPREEHAPRKKAQRSEDSLAKCRDLPQFAGFCDLRKAMLDRAHREVFKL